MVVNITGRQLPALMPENAGTVDHVLAEMLELNKAKVVRLLLQASIATFSRPCEQQPLRTALAAAGDATSAAVLPQVRTHLARAEAQPCHSLQQHSVNSCS